jgi:formate hydrogenlyase subunit 4
MTLSAKKCHKSKEKLSFTCVIRWPSILVSVRMSRSLFDFLGRTLIFLPLFGLFHFTSSFSSPSPFRALCWSRESPTMVICESTLMSPRGG